VREDAVGPNYKRLWVVEGAEAARACLAAQLAAPFGLSSNRPFDPDLTLTTDSSRRAERLGEGQSLVLTAEPERRASEGRPRLRERDRFAPFLEDSSLERLALRRGEVALAAGSISSSSTRRPVNGPGLPSRVSRSATGLYVSRDTAICSVHSCSFPSATSKSIRLRMVIQ
jgi:hypothetical protein